MNISIGARTDIGGRSNNEDCLAVLDRDRVPLRADAVLVIADGMGGRSNGEEASAIAVKIVRETVMDLLDPNKNQPLPPAEDILAAGIRRANSTIYGLSQEHPDMPGMGTTCIGALISEGLLTFAHVGDSRAYLVRENKITALTHDHTYVADQVRAGNMSAEAAKSSRFRNVITRAIGIAPTVEPDFDTFPLFDNDTILLCTDGLTNTLDEAGICEIVRRGDDAQSIAGGLLDAAKARGVRDNVTIIAVHVSSDVQSGKVRRSPLILDNADADLNTIELDEKHTGDAETSPSLELTDVHSVGQAKPSSGFRYVVLALFFTLLGALIAAVGLFEAGLVTLPNANEHAQTVKKTAPINFASYTYLPPTQLFYKPVKPDFLLLGEKGAFVALAQSGKIVHLNAFGQLDNHAPTGLASPPTHPVSDYFASDLDNNVYISDTEAKTITQVTASGNVRRLIATNLIQPGAIAVDPSGEVYVVDGGELYVLHPHTTPGKQ